MKASIAKFRSLLMAKPETAAAIVPSARFEICMDLNGDGKADFAFIDSHCDFTGNGTLDTFALDIGNDGEFDLYLKDSDGNFVPDEVYYVEDGKEGAGIMSGSEYHDTIEKALKKSVKEFSLDMVAFATGLKGGDFCLEALKKYANNVLTELGKLAPQD